MLRLKVTLNHPLTGVIKSFINFIKLHIGYIYINIYKKKIYILVHIISIQLQGCNSNLHESHYQIQSTGISYRLALA